MAVMTEFGTEGIGGKAHSIPLAQIPWRGLDNQPIPPGGYKLPPQHVLFQKETLGYLVSGRSISDPALDAHYRALTQTAQALHENVIRLFSVHGLPPLPVNDSTAFRGKSPASALKKLRQRFEKPLADTKPITDMIGITLVFPDQTDMAKTINLLRAAFPTDDMIPLGNGQFWETVHDGRNEHSHPLYRCRKVNFAFGDGQIAEAQLMTETEYHLARATDISYHNKVSLDRALKEVISPETILSLKKTFQEEDPARRHAEPVGYLADTGMINEFGADGQPGLPPAPRKPGRGR